MVGEPRSGPARPSAAQLTRWGLDPGWSRIVAVDGHDGVRRDWHVLDRAAVADDGAAGRPSLTIVCVHGNPTWSYLWRSLLRRVDARHRVIAVDQLGMGFSARTGTRSYAQRVADLGDVIDALAVDTPIVLAAHDWGGPIALGWAVEHASRVSGVALCNTGVAIPDGARAPGVIRLAAAGPLNDLLCRRTRVFLDGALALSRRGIDPIAREAYRAPYAHAADRASIRDFVADAPLDPTRPDRHPSAAAIAATAEAVRELDVPAVVVWGARDPVFGDAFADDLLRRLPNAVGHRFGDAGHLVLDEADAAGVIASWIDDRLGDDDEMPTTVVPTEHVGGDSLFRRLAARADDDAPAFVDGATGVATSFAALHRRIEDIAADLIERGVTPGARVGLLVTPGVDLLAVAYGCWRAGAVTVIADRGLGLNGLRRALRSARVEWIIGPRKALTAARVLRWAPNATRLEVDALGVESPPSEPLPPEPHGDAPAAVLFTSGATGPAKGVRYRHRQLIAQRDALAATYAITSDDRLVAAFAPFALYGPALGITSTIPDVDVTAPATLTADALAAAAASIDATMAFASPAALANVNRSANGPDARLATLRLVLSAGAPVPAATLRATAARCPAAELHTPYGMTECLPVADISLAELPPAGRGVCVGRPVPGASVMIAPIDFHADATVASVALGVTGEVLVRAPWVSDGYDRLWRTQREARPRDVDGRIWHRTGDVGHVDDQGRLWIEGRSAHLIRVDGDPLTPGPIEIAVESADDAWRAAAVGVGPPGCQQLVVIIEDRQRSSGVAEIEMTARVRAAVDHPVAAVLTIDALPVDVRHNTKIDRLALARWSATVLSGERPTRRSRR